MTWEELNSYIAGCKRCGLCEGRRNVVIGKGAHTQHGILMVGEGPGEHEDEEGIPFVGQAGRLLDLTVEAVGFDNEALYIANVVKCRPPQNREPLPEEEQACMPYLRAQFQLLQPSIVVTLGAVASKAVAGIQEGITKSRGTWIKKGSTLFMPTYHPAAILRDESKKLDFYRDLVLVKEKYDSLLTGDSE